MELHRKISSGDHVIIVSEGEFDTLITGLNNLIIKLEPGDPEILNARALRAQLIHLHPLAQ